MDTFEISRQANRVLDQAKLFSKDCLTIVDHLRDAEYFTKDDNPELSATLKKIWSKYNDIASHVENQFKQLYDVMLAYCYKSDEISKMADIELDKLNAQLEEMLAIQF